MTPWWADDKDIEHGVDERNIVKTVDFNENKNDDGVQPDEQETTASTANNESVNDVVHSIENNNQSHLRKIDPCLIIDEKSPTPYESFVKAVETYLPPTNKISNSTCTTGTENIETKTKNIINEITRECHLPLTDRQNFEPTPKEFLPFDFNDSFRFPDRVTKNQTSVRLEPTFKRKTVKLQVNFAARAPRLQGDTGANTSATDALQILHDYQEFEVPEIVGVFLQNNDSTEPTTLKALGKGYICLLSDQGTTMRWETLFTPDGSGTVLSPDNYLQTHPKFYRAFHQSGNCDNTDQSPSPIQTIRSLNQWH